MDAAAAASLQSCPTLCNPTDGSPPGSPVHGILQARTLEWVAISFSNAWKWKVKVKSPNHVRLLATPWTAAYQAPPSMGFSRQEYWSGVPLPSSQWILLNYKKGRNSFFNSSLSFLKSTVELGICIFIFIILAALLAMWNLVSPTKNQTCTLCSGSTESEPQDHQGSPPKRKKLWFKPQHG